MKRAWFKNVIAKDLSAHHRSDLSVRLEILEMNLARVEGRLVVISDPVGMAVYDFDFDLYFNCQHPIRFECEELCVLRVGAIAERYNRKLWTE